MHQPLATAVVLNWDTPFLLQNLTLPLLEATEGVDQVIVSHGQERHFRPFASDKLEVVNLRHWGEVNDTYGVARRWVAAQEARNEAILSIDNDILVSSGRLAELIHSFGSDPEIAHSCVQRCVSPKLEYVSLGDRVGEGGDSALALTGLAAHSKSLAGECLKLAPKAQDFVRRRSRPLWNGEDIFLSLVALLRSERWNRYLPIPWSEYRNQPQARISENYAAHVGYRTELLRHLAEAFQLSERLRADPRHAAAGSLGVTAPPRRRALRRLAVSTLAMLPGRPLRVLLTPRSRDGLGDGLAPALQAWAPQPDLPLADSLARTPLDVQGGIPWKLRVRERLRGGRRLCDQGAFANPAAGAALRRHFPTAKVLLVLPDPARLVWELEGAPASKSEAGKGSKVGGAAAKAGKGGEAGEEAAQKLLDGGLRREEQLAGLLPPMLQGPHSQLAQTWFAQAPDRCPLPVLRQRGYGPWLEFWLCALPAERLLVVPEEGLLQPNSEARRLAADFLAPLTLPEGTQNFCLPPVPDPLRRHFAGAAAETAGLLHGYGHRIGDEADIWQDAWPAPPTAPQKKPRAPKEAQKGD